MVRIIIFFLFLSTNLFSQSRFQTWPTISLKGEVIDNLDVKFKYRNKYDHKESSSVTSWFNMGLEYKLNKSSFGIYYRELHRIKSSEKRPHLDITYQLNDNMKIRLRNEYRIKEINDNVFRYRLRYSYSLKLFDNYNPFVQNEIFLSENSFIRNRINLGLNIKFEKTPFVFKPSYILESNRNGSGENITWSKKNIFVLALSIKI